jgi:predicted ATP-grasp superfamily ATP-dependent carboligase
VRDPAELVNFLTQPHAGERLVLIEALDGFVDAGQGVRLAREHLAESFEPQTVVRFDVDELLDHRSRRPVLLFDTDHWEDYEAPTISVQLYHDANRTPFLLLDGPEPDVQWERFIAAVFIVVERIGVRLTVGLHSVPWAAPHTRPIMVTSHGRPQELLATPPLGIGKVRVPASVGHLLEYRLGVAGHAAIGFAAHTPYYLSNVEYPSATVALLESVERAAGLSLALDPLRSRALEVESAIDSQIADNEQVRSLVRQLEEHDEPTPGYGISADESEIPTAEELGADFQRFLAERARRPNLDDPPA